jgi:hypothetical protein
VTVVHEPRHAWRSTASWHDELHLQRRFVATVPAFSGIPPFLRGSALLATLPGLLRLELLRGFGHAELPVDVTSRDADVHGVARAPAERPRAPLAA